MHILIRSIFFSLIATTVLAQHPCTATTTPPAETIRINKLIIESSTLPAPDRKQLTHLLQQQSYTESELRAGGSGAPDIEEHVMQALRERGYFKAQASNVSFTPQPGSKAVDVTVKVEPGPQYRLGQIRFENVTVFSSNQLRQLVPLQSGDLFNATEFSKSLDALRNLYSTRGYVDMVLNPVPRIDESRHVINLVLSLDEGKPYNFGQLSLEGVEPHAGAAKALLATWKPLEGKPYNSLELQKWFDANRPTWHASPDRWQAISSLEQFESRVVNITLKQPCW
jgi:outer membrane protein assembly factor BamA